MKKKLYLISAMYSSRGHGQEYIRNFAEHLHQHFDIILFVASREHIEAHPKHFSIVTLPVDYARTNADRFQKYGMFSSYFRAVSKQYLSMKYYRMIVKSGMIRSGDIVYIMDYDVIPLVGLVSSLKKLGAQTYLWIHSAKFNSRDLVYSAYKTIFRIVFKRRIESNVRKIIVNGQFIASQLQNALRLNPSSIAIIQYPSQISHQKTHRTAARTELGIPTGDNIILFFGLLRTDKNLKTLVESVSLCQTSIRLIIAGAEASVTKEQLLEWIQKYEVKNYLLDIDYISEERMALYYSASDLLLLTYNTESASQSGPLSLAREFELPALVTDVGEIGNYVKANKIGMVSQCRADKFAEAIDRFFALSFQEKEQLQNHLKAAKAKYSWRTAAEKYRELFS